MSLFRLRKIHPLHVDLVNFPALVKDKIGDGFSIPIFFIGPAKGVVMPLLQRRLYKMVDINLETIFVERDFQFAIKRVTVFSGIIREWQRRYCVEDALGFKVFLFFFTFCAKASIEG